MKLLQSRTVRRLAFFAGGAMLWTGPAPAQDDRVAALDPIAEASTDVEAGMALAAQQSAAGDLVEAAATLERVLLLHPLAHRALIVHAGLLCRLDDAEGGRIELAKFLNPPVADPAWTAAIGACGAMPVAANQGTGK
ncbi:MAG: hypothetical protein B7Y45_00445 [Sphingomonas sp. 28-66-16]|nr:MAG: hypothetical protein B7Y45_00445 [Sphingomonas sp. 28-66-16]